MAQDIWFIDVEFHNLTGKKMFFSLKNEKQIKKGG